MAYSPDDAPCCPNCGGEDLQTLKSQVWWGERSVSVQCRVCRFQFVAKPPEVEVAATYQTLRCVDCNGALVVYCTRGAVRHLKCDNCSRTVKLAEQVVRA